LSKLFQKYAPKLKFSTGEGGASLEGCQFHAVEDNEGGGRGRGSHMECSRPFVIDFDF